MNRRNFLRAAAVHSVLLGAPLPIRAQADFLPSWVENSRPMMGTFVSVAIRHRNVPTARQVIADCFTYIEKQIALLSTWQSSSVASKLNRERRLPLSECPASFFSLLQHAADIERKTSGLFNPLLYSLTKLWREARAVDAGLDRLTIQHELDVLRRSCLRFEQQQVVLEGGAGVEFGGIGKGYVADLAKNYLQAAGVQQVRVDCGGDLRFSGAGPWLIDIVHPRADRLLGTITVLNDFGVATSGDYVNGSMIAGTRIHHLLDTRSGRPTSGNQSVTVVAPAAVTADAIATAAFALPAAEVLRLTTRFPATDVLVVDSLGEIHKSRRLRFSAAS